MVSIKELSDNTKFVSITENQKLFKICKIIQNIFFAYLQKFKLLAASVMLNVTSSFRFPGEHDMRKMVTCLTPFIQLHYFLTSLAPIQLIYLESSRVSSESDLIKQMFDSNNFLNTHNPNNCKFYSSCLIFRGALSLL